MVLLYRWFPSVLKAITIIRPETLVRWHRAGFRRYWRWKSRSLGGRPKIAAELRALIRDCVYGAAVTRRLRRIRDKPIASGSPWQNGFAERLIGSIRRECVDHVIVLGEAHLRRILTKYAAYYNELRNSSVSWQRRSDPSRHPARRPHRIAVAPGRTSSPLLQNLIFDTDTIRWLIGKGLKADLQARKK